MRLRFDQTNPKGVYVCCSSGPSLIEMNLLYAGPRGRQLSEVFPPGLSIRVRMVGSKSRLGHAALHCSALHCTALCSIASHCTACPRRSFRERQTHRYYHTSRFLPSPATSWEGSRYHQLNAFLMSLQLGAEVQLNFVGNAAISWFVVDCKS